MSRAASAAEAMRFGLDVASAKAAIDRGVPISYGSMWAGAWNQRWGWGGIESQLRAARAAGVVPVIQWWYWGDDISPACVEQGCWDARQGVAKDKATWYRLSNELADLVVNTLGRNSTALVIVETEFNKQGIETYEPFDGYLTEISDLFHQHGLQVIISFGNWGKSNWTRFDRAVGRADYLGTMALQSSVHEASTYLTGADMLVDAAAYLHSTFGKPCFVTDFAFSSYPTPAWEGFQDTIIKIIFGRLDALKAAGVRGMVWRMLQDDPQFDTSNYHGMAERYWGLLRADGSEKPGFFAFSNGAHGETQNPAPAPGLSSTPAPSVAVPGAPSGLTASVSGSSVTLVWTAPAVGGQVTSYVVEAGASPGVANLAVLNTGTNATSFNATSVGAGTYYVRVRAANAGGNSAPSNEIVLTVRPS